MTAGLVIRLPLWLTRDSPNGTLLSWVDVWTSKPTRIVEGTRVVWINAVTGNIEGRCMFLKNAECVARFGTLPDDNKMIIRIGKTE